MDTCGRCGTEELQHLSVDDSLEVAGHLFVSQLPAQRCQRCGDIRIEARHLRQLESAAVLLLARSGERTGSAIRAQRKGLRLSTTRLAELLDVSAPAVCAWEEGSSPVPAASAALLRSVVVSQLAGGAEPLDGLALLRQPRRLAQKIRVHLQESMTLFALGVEGPALA